MGHKAAATLTTEKPVAAPGEQQIAAPVRATFAAPTLSDTRQMGVLADERKRPASEATLARGAADQECKKKKKWFLRMVIPPKGGICLRL